MAPDKPVQRRVNVGRLVGEAVVVAVVARPPKHTLLDCALGSQGEDELEGAARPEGAVGEVPVVAGGDEEHPRRVGAGGEEHLADAEAGEPRYGQGRELEGE